MSTAGAGEVDNIEQSTDVKFPAEQTVGTETIESPTPAKTISQTSTVSGVESTDISKTSITGQEVSCCIPEERQVIAVSASKNPAAFFNLARRFLVTDEYCDLSALEGAIVSAVDAAHLLERSKLAKIVRWVSACMFSCNLFKKEYLAVPPVQSTFI